jgi:hypothetical protein
MEIQKSDYIRYIDFEISSLCNAGCPVCPRRHNGHYSEFTQTYWSKNEVERVVDPNIIKNLYGILFCGNFGDAMGNPEVAEITEYFRSNNEKMSIHVKTNGGIGNPSDYEKMAKMNCIFTFGLDGVGKSNELHRVNVKWDKVLKNVEAFTSNCKPYQFEIQFIMWNETIDQIVPMIEFIQSIGFGKLYLRNPFTTGTRTEVYDMKGVSTHFLTEITDDRLHKYLDTTWEFEQLEDIKNDITSMDVKSGIIEQGSMDIYEREYYSEKTYEYNEFEFEEKLVNKLKNKNEQTCSSKNTKDPSDLNGNAHNIYITHNGLLMPCCYLPPYVSNRMTHSSGKESSYQKEILNKMLEIGFDNFSLKNTTLRELFNTGLVHKFVYDDLLNGNPMNVCKLICNKCSGEGINDNKD